MTTLVFPSSVPAAKSYLRAARRRGESTVSASSSGNGGEDETGPWVHLPNIHAPDFNDALETLIRIHNITHVYPTVLTVQLHLEKWIAERRTPIRITDDAPVLYALEEANRVSRDYGALYEFARTIIPDCDLGPLESFCGSIRASLRVFGESYEEKLAALLAVLADIPDGDVVEIGGLFGRSSLALECGLNRLKRTNAVLVIDPWDNAIAVQSSLPAHIRERIAKIDASSVLASFDMDLSPLARPDLFNRIQAFSTDVANDYGGGWEISSPAFGTTRYTGRVSLLHIDGNHDLEAVRADYESWLPHMTPGGWIIFDDYTWSHGTGPKEVADDALHGLADGQSRFERSFVCNGALFAKLAAE